MESSCWYTISSFKPIGGDTLRVGPSKNRGNGLFLNETKLEQGDFLLFYNGDLLESRFEDAEAWNSRPDGTTDFSWYLTNR